MEHWKNVSEFISKINSNFERRNDMKKLLVVLVAVVALTGLMVGQGFGVVTDKLKVMNNTGSATKFVVRDDGTVGVNNPTALGYGVDISAGLAPGAMLINPQLHFSSDSADSGGYLSSALPNNFYVSSGAAMINGTWTQKSADGKAVLAGSGGAGYRIFTSSGNTVGNPITLSTRMYIDYSGNVGFGVTPAYPIHMASGARVTVGGVWTDASSRAYKENIQDLSAEKAVDALKNLNPVVYNYKVDAEEKHVGFIAEDVPSLVATKDRKALSPMDIVAVLTKVVQEQTKTIEALSAKVDMLEKATTK